MPKNKVLIPLNESELSRQILPHIERFITTHENELILFYISKPPRSLGLAKPDPGSGYALKPGGEPVGPKPYPVYAHQQEDSLQAHIEADLLPVMNRLKEKGYEVLIMVDFSEDTVEEILRVILAYNIDLVAMSIRARDGVKRFFFRDLAEKISQQTDIPLLIVHPQSANS
jgi:nucleotide-binding universal stress UspA family protein